MGGAAPVPARGRDSPEVFSGKMRMQPDPEAAGNRDALFRFRARADEFGWRGVR